MEQFDVVIIGAGPAGCASALALCAQPQLRVAIINKPSSVGRYRIGESATPSVSQLLRQLNVPHQLDDLGHVPCYGSIAQWGSSAIVEQDFITHGQGNGWHINREAFDDWLRMQAQQRGATVFNDSQFIKVGRLTDNHWGIATQQRGVVKYLACKSLIDASGRGSCLAKKLGAKRQNIDNLIAVAYLTTPRHQHSLAHLSLVESHPLGWWYSAGLPDGRAVVCFMSDADIVSRYQLADTAVFTNIYNESDQVSANVPPPNIGSGLTVYAAHSGFINRVAGNGWIAVGDAALGMDPLTSSGINCALADGIAAAEATTHFLAGNNQTLRQHADKMNNTVGHYLQERRAFYQREQRWSGEPFWRRRHGRPG